MCHGVDVEEEVMPNEEDLVDAQVSWDVGKALGLHVSNERTMFEALSKVYEVQDFVLPRKKDRPIKNKGRSKD